MGGHGWRPGHSQPVDLLTRKPALDFLEIPQQKWTGIIESTVRASVEELAYLNRIRFYIDTDHDHHDGDPLAKSLCASQD